MAEFLEQEVYASAITGAVGGGVESCLATPGYQVPSRYYYTHFWFHFKCDTDGNIWMRLCQDREKPEDAEPDVGENASFYGAYSMINACDGTYSIWDAFLGASFNRSNLVKYIASRSDYDDFINSTPYKLATWEQHTPYLYGSAKPEYAYFDLYNNRISSSSTTSADDPYIYDFARYGDENGFVNIGNIEDIEINTNGDIVIYVCGLTMFSSFPTNGINTYPYELIVNGLAIYLKYFPWAILKSNVWESANRSGGSHRMLKSSAWRDDKNSVSENADQTVHQLRSGSWRRCDKIGANG